MSQQVITFISVAAFVTIYVTFFALFDIMRQNDGSLSTIGSTILSQSGEGRYINHSAFGTSVCTFDSCVEFAEVVKLNVDETAHPCKDFYQFACGSFELNHNGSSMIREIFQAHEKQFVDSSATDETHAFQAYRACVTASEQKDFASKFLAKLGGAPCFSDKDAEYNATQLFASFFPHALARWVLGTEELTNSYRWFIFAACDADVTRLAADYDWLMQALQTLQKLGGGAAKPTRDVHEYQKGILEMGKEFCAASMEQQRDFVSTKNLISNKEIFMPRQFKRMIDDLKGYGRKLTDYKKLLGIVRLQAVFQGGFHDTLPESFREVHPGLSQAQAGCVRWLRRNYATFPYTWEHKYVSKDAVEEITNNVYDATRATFADVPWIGYDQLHLFERKIERLSPDPVDVPNSGDVVDKMFPANLDNVDTSRKFITLDVNREFLSAPLFSPSLPYEVQYGIAGTLFASTLAPTTFLQVLTDDEAKSALQERLSCLDAQFANATNSALSPNVSYAMPEGCTVHHWDQLSYKLAYQAYKYASANVNPQPPTYRFPGLESISEDQMFFVSAAQLFCQREEFSEQELPGPHPRVRVNNALKNSPEFASAFNCEVGSEMRPEKTCNLWATIE